MKILLSVDCVALTLALWGDDMIFKPRHESGIKEIFLSIASSLIEKGLEDNLQEAGLRQVHLKIRGEAKSEGYFAMIKRKDNH